MSGVGGPTLLYLKEGGLRWLPSSVRRGQGVVVAKGWQGSLDGIADGTREVGQKSLFAHLGPLAPAPWTNQDDARHALAFYTLHVPPRVDGFLRRGQLPVAIPATASARRADRI
jgi:hypothetical protein